MFSSRLLVIGRTKEGLDLTHAQFVMTLPYTEQYHQNSIAKFYNLNGLRKILNILGIETVNENEKRR